MLGMEIAGPTSGEAVVHQVGNRAERILVIDAQTCSLGQELTYYPLVFSQLPRCQGLCGSKKYARRRSGARHRPPVFSLKETEWIPTLLRTASIAVGEFTAPGRKLQSSQVAPSYRSSIQISFSHISPLRVEPRAQLPTK